MAFYTLCAAGEDRKARPCALIEAVSDSDAEQQAVAYQHDGLLAFLPDGQHFILRRASRAEVTSYLEWMQLKPGRSPAALDGALNPRARRMRLAFFRGLWSGEIDPYKDIPPRRRSAPSQA